MGCKQCINDMLPHTCLWAQLSCRHCNCPCVVMGASLGADQCQHEWQGPCYQGLSTELRMALRMRTREETLRKEP